MATRDDHETDLVSVRRRTVLWEHLGEVRVLACRYGPGFRTKLGVLQQTFGAVDALGEEMAQGRWVAAELATALRLPR